jgi:hypothetical protein
MDMALTISGEQVEAVLRKLLPRQSYELRNPPRRKGQTGADILAQKNGRLTAVECIGFQDIPPLRSKQFYEAFFRAISRLEQGVEECVMALPQRFGSGMERRARHYGIAWKRIAEAFPELEIWLVDTETSRYVRTKWGDWLTQKPKSSRPTWNPKKGIGALVLGALKNNANINYAELRDQVLQRFPKSKFNKSHFAWYKSQFRKRR